MELLEVTSSELADQEVHIEQRLKVLFSYLHCVLIYTHIYYISERLSVIKKNKYYISERRLNERR